MAIAVETVVALAVISCIVAGLAFLFGASVAEQRFELSPGLRDLLSQLLWFAFLAFLVTQVVTCQREKAQRAYQSCVDRGGAWNGSFCEEKK